MIRKYICYLVAHIKGEHSIIHAYVIFVHNKFRLEINLMISEQDLLHSTKMATHPQMLVNSDDLVTKMRELAEDNEDNKDDVKPMVVKFLTDTRDPTIGSIDREVVTLVQHPFACQGKEGKHDDNKGCPICLEPFDNPIELLNCNHKFCAGCLISSFAVKQECPICRTGHGKIYGTMPKDATMTVIRAEWSLPGYESCGTIIVQYNIPSGIQTVSPCESNVIRHLQPKQTCTYA